MNFLLQSWDVCIYIYIHIIHFMYIIYVCNMYVKFPGAYWFASNGLSVTLRF